MVSITLDWETRYTAMGGIISSTVAAITLPEREIPLAAIWFIATGNVFKLSLKIVPLEGVTDQIPWKANNNNVIHAGLMIGITMRQ